MTKMYYVNDNKDIARKSFQIMTFFYKNPINCPNPRTKERKGRITYYKTYGITTLKKHGNVNHGIIAKTF